MKILKLGKKKKKKIFYGANLGALFPVATAFFFSFGTFSAVM